jgi:hypothetical protein
MSAYEWTWWMDENDAFSVHCGRIQHPTDLVFIQLARTRDPNQFLVWAMPREQWQEVMALWVDLRDNGLIE